MNRGIYEYYVQSDVLAHHGILGQKWGVRRYQNPDGSLTEEGIKRYYGDGEYKSINFKQATKEYYNNFDSNNISSTNRDSLKEEMDSDLKSLLDKVKNAKYDTDEWYEARDNYYDEMDKYASAYAAAFLKDINMKIEDAKELKKFGDWMGIGEGYCNTWSDYRSISDPVTGDRDYDLKGPSKEYSNNRKYKVISNQTGLTIDEVKDKIANYESLYPEWKKNYKALEKEMFSDNPNIDKYKELKQKVEKIEKQMDKEAKALGYKNWYALT